MKIESKYLRNEEANFSGLNVKFNKHGISDVKAELGTRILENFPEDYWEFGKKLKSKVVKKLDKTEEEYNANINMLQKEVERQKQMVTTLKGQVGGIQKSEKVWKDEVDKLIVEKAKLEETIIAFGGKKIEEKVNVAETPKSDGKEAKGTELEEALSKMEDKEEIISLLKDMKVPEKEFTKLEREELIALVLAKSE